MLKINKGPEAVPINVGRVSLRRELQREERKRRAVLGTGEGGRERKVRSLIPAALSESAMVAKADKRRRCPVAREKESEVGKEGNGCTLWRALWIKVSAELTQN